MRREVDPDIYCPQAALVDEELNRKTQQRLERYRKRYYEQRKRREQNIMLQHQQQQKLWIVGGTSLVILGLSLYWYKRSKYNTQQKRRDDRGHEIPRDLFFDEHDDNVTEVQLQQVFNEATKVARKFTNGMLNQKDQLMLYGLYKQACEGDRCDDNAPSKINIVAHAKYDAWGKFKGLPKSFAMKKYCEVVYHFSNGGQSAYTDKNVSGNDNDDVVYVDDNDKHAELDEDGCPVNANDDGGIMTGMGIRQSTMADNTEHLSSRKPVTTNTSPEIRLRYAAVSNDVDTLKEVINGDCDIDGADEQGQTALHFATDRGSIDCIKLLVEKGANINAKDSDGIGILQTALSAELDVDFVRLLLEAGANPDAQDIDGDSPRMWVEESGDKALMDLFEAIPERY